MKNWYINKRYAGTGRDDTQGPYTEEEARRLCNLFATRNYYWVKLFQLTLIAQWGPIDAGVLPEGDEGSVPSFGEPPDKVEWMPAL